MPDPKPFQLEPPPVLKIGAPPRRRRSKSAGVPDPEWEAGFHSDFWPAYPRKAAKLDALRAWHAIQPHDEPTFNAIMDGLERAKPVFLRREKESIPHPATWLNGRRWEDEDQ